MKGGFSGAFEFEMFAEVLVRVLSACVDLSESIKIMRVLEYLTYVRGCSVQISCE